MLTLLDRYKVPFYHQKLEEQWGYLVSKDGQQRRNPFRVKLNTLNNLTTIKSTTIKVWAQIVLNMFFKSPKTCRTSAGKVSKTVPKQFPNSFEKVSNKNPKQFPTSSNKTPKVPQQFQTSFEQVSEKFPKSSGVFFCVCACVCVCACACACACVCASPMFGPRQEAWVYIT